MLQPYFFPVVIRKRTEEIRRMGAYDYGYDYGYPKSILHVQYKSL